jgi:hypothetical protein
MSPTFDLHKQYANEASDVIGAVLHREKSDSTIKIQELFVDLAEVRSTHTA